MHYVAYLDEFGHIGPFVARNHDRYKTSPVFGFAGVLLPIDQVREFAIYFYKLKCRLLDFEIKQDGRPAYRWEKKGAQLFTTRNVSEYRQLRSAINSLLNHIEKIGGHVFYTGEHKTVDPRNHNSTETFKQQLIQSIRKIDRFCIERKSTFMLMLDEQQAGNEWRESNMEACTLAMFEDATEKCRTLVEPPLQAESHLFQTLQCADWICGLIGRLTAYEISPVEYEDWQLFAKYFRARVDKIALDCSGLEPQKSFVIPAEQAMALGQELPNASGDLAGS